MSWIIAWLKVGQILGSDRVEIFLRTFVSRLLLGLLKMITGPQDSPGIVSWNEACHSISASCHNYYSNTQVIARYLEIDILIFFLFAFYRTITLFSSGRCDCPLTADRLDWQSHLLLNKVIALYVSDESI